MFSENYDAFPGTDIGNRNFPPDETDMDTELTLLSMPKMSKFMNYNPNPYMKQPPKCILNPLARSQINIFPLNSKPSSKSNTPNTNQSSQYPRKNPVPSRRRRNSIISTINQRNYV